MPGETETDLKSGRGNRSEERRSRERCLLCETNAILLNSDHPGYMKPERYSIYECPFCDLQFARPSQCRGDIYELIYQNSASLPGYARYERYAHRVSQQTDPLKWLADQEDVYWFARVAILEQHLASTDPVYEIGSGLGYLTFALRRSGVLATGLDISGTAVSAATKRFGPYYRTAPAGRLSDIAPGTAAVVVMTELIEHVEDPGTLLADVRRLLRPGGMALVTTPNKSFFPMGAYWRSENPPVHLWWFSETSMRRLAARLHFDISFFDFTAFNSLKAGLITPEVTTGSNTPHLDENGIPVVHEQAASFGLAHKVGVKVKRMLCTWHGDSRLAITRASADVMAQRSNAMGAILTRPIDSHSAATEFASNDPLISNAR